MKYENLAYISRGKYSSIEELNQVIKFFKGFFKFYIKEKKFSYKIKNINNISKY